MSESDIKPKDNFSAWRQFVVENKGKGWSQAQMSQEYRKANNLPPKEKKAKAAAPSATTGTTLPQPPIAGYAPPAADSVQALTKQFETLATKIEGMGPVEKKRRAPSKPSAWNQFIKDHQGDPDIKEIKDLAQRTKALSVKYRAAKEAAAKEAAPEAAPAAQ